MSGNFCNAQHQVFSRNVNVTDLEEASGLAVATGGNFFYTANDSPEGNCVLFAFEKSTMRRILIEITGVESTGFNANRQGEGYGDWEAMAITRSPQHSGKKCIVIADTGHNAVRGMGGRLRTDAQQTRLIYVEEPYERELVRALTLPKPVLSKRGVVYPIQYTSRNLKFDAEAMAVSGDTIMIITKNCREGKGDKHSFVYAIQNDLLHPDKLNTLECKGQMTIAFSEVTDAFATKTLLCLRTYQGLNFYALSDLCPGRDAELRGYHDLRPLADDGAQEAIAYDYRTKTIYLLGEGSTNMYSLQMNTQPMSRGSVPMKGNGDKGRGSGNGKGEGYGKGDGHGNNNNYGNGNGYGNGYGKGDGKGDGYGDGKGTPRRTSMKGGKGK